MSTGDGFKVSSNFVKAASFVLAALAMVGGLIAAGVAKTNTIERHGVRIGNVEATLTELKGDIHDRLDRIENKVDRLVERR